MSTTKGLKAIAPVPTAMDFLDIVLNKTQRKTPTVSSYFEPSLLVLWNWITDIVYFDMLVNGTIGYS